MASDGSRGEQHSWTFVDEAVFAYRPTVPEEDAVLLRRCAQMAVEACSYRGGSSEPREPAELFDRLVGRLKQYAGSIDASAGQPLHR